MMKLRIPATSANMGPGFDCLGIAVNLYNYITAEETESGLDIEIIDDTRKYLPCDKSNLIYKSMQVVFDKCGYTPKGIKLILENNVPIARGLGSSSTGIVGGLMAGNAIAGHPYSKDELLNMATELEGHADNVSPAILGGFTVNVFQKGIVRYVNAPLKDDIKFAAFIPSFSLQTKKARAALPMQVSHKDAAYNTGHAALMAASLMSGNYQNLRFAVNDKLHQNYRKSLIPGMQKIFDLAYKNKALCTYLSGAGPTIGAIISTDNTDFEPKVNEVLKSEFKDWSLHILDIDNEGAKEI